MFQNRNKEAWLKMILCAGMIGVFSLSDGGLSTASLVGKPKDDCSQHELFVTPADNERRVQKIPVISAKLLSQDAAAHTQKWQVHMCENNNEKDSLITCRSAVLR